MMARILIVFIVIFALIGSLTARKRIDDIWLGGGIGVVQPSNIGGKDDLGFKDVASTGFQLNVSTRWFYATRLSLGGELSYSMVPQNDDFWYVRNYGEVTNHYRIANMMAFGHYYFSHDEWRPYAGIGFGAAFLMNKLDFNSNYTGTDADASVSYKTYDWKPCFAPEIGVLAELSNKLFFYATFRFQVIPNMTPTIVELKDETGYIIDFITQNPHGHENHFLINLGLLFKL